MVWYGLTQAKKKRVHKVNCKQNHDCSSGDAAMAIATTTLTPNRFSFFASAVYTVAGYTACVHRESVAAMLCDQGKRIYNSRDYGIWLCLPPSCVANPSLIFTFNRDSSIIAMFCV